MAVAAQEITDQWAAYNGDCLEVLPTLPDGKVHFSIYSPPFGGLYHYSSSDRDLSNNDDYDTFFEHYRFVVQELFRVTMPGRMTAVHAAPIPSGNSGKDYMIDFPGDVIRLHAEEGFEWVARYVIWKEPLAVRNRTMAKNLAHKTIIDDATRAGNASADELLVFRRKGENPVPVEHPTGFLSYAGAAKMPADILQYRDWGGDQKLNKFSHWIWRRYASSIWDDIRLNNVLPHQESKDEDDEKHVHPLQLDVIERAVHLWTNPGETVLTPFMGVGSEVYVPAKLGRRAIGVELKASYYRQALKNLATVDMPEVEQPTIFQATGS